MRVAVTGGTGFVGSRLLPVLLDAGHDVLVLVRDAQRAKARVPEGVTVAEYDAFDEDSVFAALSSGEGDDAGSVDAVINLAGENITSRRWTGAGCQILRDSRVVTTRRLVRAMKRLEPTPKVFVSGSAVGFYGDRDADHPGIEGQHNATQFAPTDFLSGLCREWEAAARTAEVMGTRVVRARIGVVLGQGGGALAEMEVPFKMGAGGPIGSGKQIVSWIHIEDCARMLAWALEQPELKGPLNVTAPNPVTNKELSTALGDAMHRPSFMPVPVIALRLLKGKIAGMLATGQPVPPTKALEHGFLYRYPTLAEAFADIYGAVGV